VPYCSWAHIAGWNLSTLGGPHEWYNMVPCMTWGY
jgi:hypothetical protein